MNYSVFWELWNKFASVFMVDIPISEIICQKNETSIKEGWGGKNIEYFPPYSFYKIYLSGKPKKAKDEMEKWYYNRFIKENLYSKPKMKGGMLEGSLFRHIAKVHKSNGIELNFDLSNAKDKFIKRGIKEKVESRFSLLTSIFKNDYQYSGDFIRLQKVDGKFNLIDGHHRVAAMAVCGHSTIQGVVNNNIILKIVKIAHNLKSSE